MELLKFAELKNHINYHVPSPFPSPPAGERGRERENRSWWWRSVHKEGDCLLPESSI
ncbi:MAG: hypothetical protein MUP68_05690 [Deltaproteobacteria bacterium]|nr:hypothetical protein [Deltaproteobacteria bacterium]